MATSDALARDEAALLNLCHLRPQFANPYIIYISAENKLEL